MRSQKIVTIDTGAKRKVGESEKDYFDRVDEKLTIEITAHQMAWMNWQLLSVSSAGKQGVFLTTWEYEPEKHEDVKSEEIEEGVRNEVYDAVSTYPSVHQVKHGDVINVNGELFTLVAFQKDNGGASVDFMSVDDMTDSLEDPMGTYSRYGRSRPIRRSEARSIMGRRQTTSEYGRG